ncbi:MAG: homoserine dehydrogenase [Vulcanimicrobiaceae bacterium]
MERLSLTHPAHADRTDVGRDVRIALLGCGTVGSGVARLLVNATSSVPARSGVDYWLAGIAVRSLAKPRPPEIPSELFGDDARALACDPEIDVVIECIGGSGIAAELVVAALERGKHVVTANKELLATRGPQLRALAAAHGVTIACEAAVGGAIPIVRTLAESLAGEEILEVGGVLNGTTNFILSQMFEGATYERALAEAQRLGFAEADPRNDVEGIDAAHKLAILAQLAFRRALTTDEIPRSGIVALVPADHSLARRAELRLKLVACARAESSIVTPAYVPVAHPFAHPVGPQNCIRVIGRNSGSLTFADAGAGGFPTASSVVGDVVAVLHRIAAGRIVGTPTADERLAPERAPEAAVSLRRIVRLRSLGDVRPALLGLGEAGIAAEPLGDLPAVISEPLGEPRAAEVAAAVRTHHVAAQSTIPLWEDIASEAPSSNVNHRPQPHRRAKTIPVS